MLPSSGREEEQEKINQPSTAYAICVALSAVRLKVPLDGLVVGSQEQQRRRRRRQQQQQQQPGGSTNSGGGSSLITTTATAATATTATALLLLLLLLPPSTCTSSTEVADVHTNVKHALPDFSIEELHH